MTATDRSTASGTDPEFEAFILWMIAALGLHCETRESGGYALKLPDEPSRQRFSGQSELGIVFDARHMDSSGQTTLVTPESPVLDWLVERSGQLIHTIPGRDATSVHELTEPLYGAYQVDGGQVRLAGCSLEEHPFLRTTFLAASAAAPLEHIYTATDGTPVAAERVESLGLDHLTIRAGRPPVSRSVQMDTWTGVAPPPHPQARRLLVSAIWTRFAQGKLEFVIGKRTAELPFSGWAQLIRDGVVKPPAFECLATGRKSHHLAVTDDGRISVWESIAACSESGKRVLVNELETCAVTGKHALPEYFGRCSYSDDRVLAGALESCSVCQETVSPQVLSAEQCPACRKLRSVHKDDPRMARLLDEYPLLDRWRRWKISESPAVYVLVAASLVKQLLLVVDKQTLALRHMATRGLMSRRWTIASEHERQEWLASA